MTIDQYETVAAQPESLVTSSAAPLDVYKIHIIHIVQTIFHPPKVAYVI